MDQSTTSKARPMTSTQGSWFAILAVAIAAFALVHSEFLPVGVLNSVAADLHISVGTAGSYYYSIRHYGSDCSPTYYPFQ